MKPIPFPVEKIVDSKLQLIPGFVKGLVVNFIFTWWKHGCPDFTEENVRITTGVQDQHWQRKKKRSWSY